MSVSVKKKTHQDPGSPTSPLIETFAQLAATLLTADRFKSLEADVRKPKLISIRIGSSVECDQELFRIFVDSGSYRKKND